MRLRRPMPIHLMLASSLLVSAVSAEAAPDEQDSITVRSAHAAAIFEALQPEARTLGVLTYCGKEGQFPDHPIRILAKIMARTTEPVGSLAHEQQTFEVRNMVFAYAYGLTFGLEMQAGNRPPDPTLCRQAVESGERLFADMKEESAVGQ